MTTATEQDVELLTVPDVAAALGVKVDRLRHVIRTRPEVASLFRRTGPLRLLPVSRLDELRRVVGG